MAEKQLRCKACKCYDKGWCNWEKLAGAVRWIVAVSGGQFACKKFVYPEK